MEVILIIVVFIALYVRTNKIDRRLTHVERYLEQTSKQTTEVGAAPNAEPAEPQPALVAAAPSEERSVSRTPEMAALGESARREGWPTTGEPTAGERFIDWVSTDWLMKLGGFLVILAVGWFVSYAFAHDWIGPSGRIALGFVAGAALLALGRWRMERFVAQGSVVMFVGAVTVVLTMYAARIVYGFFDPYTALGIMFVTAALLGTTSVVFKHKPLAYGNVLLAALAPLLLGGAPIAPATLLSYLFVLSLGAVWVTVLTGWRELPLVSLVIVWLYGAPYITTAAPGTLDVTLLFAFAFTALFFLVSVGGMRVAGRAQLIDLAMAAASGLYLLVWVVGAAPHDWQSMLLVVWTLVFAAGAYRAVAQGADTAFFYAYAGVGVVLLGAATAIELSGPDLTIAAIFEASAILWVGYRITGRAAHLPALAAPFLVPIILSLPSIGAAEWHTGILHEHAVVLGLMLAACAFAALFFERVRLNVPGEERVLVSELRDTAWTIVVLYALVLVWLVTHALFPSPESGTMAALFVYTLVAMMFYMAGRQSGKHWQRLVAGLLIALVVGRLLLVEVAGMETGWRIVTFAIIGAVLMTVAWLERNMFRGRTDTAPECATQPPQHE